MKKTLTFEVEADDFGGACEFVIMGCLENLNKIHTRQGFLQSVANLMVVICHDMIDGDHDDVVSELIGAIEASHREEKGGVN